MPSSNTNKARAPIVISMGDPAGIGPEIVSKAWTAREVAGLQPFVYMGDPALIHDVPTQIVDSPNHAAAVFKKALPILLQTLAIPAFPGTPNARNAAATLEALTLSAKLCLDGQASAMVTAPVAKEQLYSAGFTAPGQTEYLADICSAAHSDTVMMLAGPSLRVVPLTIHMALSDVPTHLTQHLIMSRARVTHKALIRDFGIAKPRLAFCGLNPHAGEKGTIGLEDIDIIAPAIAQLRGEGIDASGPFAADSLFHAEARKTYDAALSMYHDQGLIPIKTLHFYDGVNVTLGLPIVRTSPDHGTAFDIAGKGQADARSMIAALQMAGDIASRRAEAVPCG